MRIRDLQQAQFRPVGALAQKFGIERDRRGPRQAFGKRFEGLGRSVIIMCY